MKVKLIPPVLLGAMPLVVFENGENWLSIATKYLFAGSKPVPVATTAAEELATNDAGLTVKFAVTVNVFEADVSKLSFVVAVTVFAPPGDVGTTNVVVN
jgi:hypothetical protein